MTTTDDLERMRDAGAEIFDGFLILGFGVTLGRDNNGPCCCIRHGVDVPRAERLIVQLQGQIRMLEDLVFQGPPPPPPTEGEQWKHQH